MRLIGLGSNIRKTITSQKVPDISTGNFDKVLLSHKAFDQRAFIMHHHLKASRKSSHGPEEMDPIVEKLLREKASAKNIKPKQPQAHEHLDPIVKELFRQKASANNTKPKQPQEYEHLDPIVRQLSRQKATANNKPKPK